MYAVVSALLGKPHDNSIPNAIEFALSTEGTGGGVVLPLIAVSMELVGNDETPKLFTALMRESLFSHPHAKWLIEAEGEPEISLFWNEETTGELAKCRPDKLISKHSCIVDLKTTGDIEHIEKSFFNYRYHVQDAWYTKGYETAYNDKLSSFIFLVVSTKLNCGRYPVRLFELAREVKEHGKTEYLEDIATYHECKTSNDWAAIETIKLPYYME